MDKLDVLRDYFGHSSFRDGQAEVIDHILMRNDVLAVMPTGAGKSLCYQIPALLLDGITIVISPLISLMKDQVSALVSAGISADCINSSLSYEEQRYALYRAENGDLKILYVAPERLDNPDFLYFAQHANIAMVTVDEAHCVSQWGQDFRPSYLRIVDFIQNLPYRPIIGAFTATATAAVRDDIIRILHLQNPFSITTGFDRANLYFSVMKPENKYAALVKLLKGYGDRCGIVYCLTRKNVEEVCAKLVADGFPATRYHAGLPDAERRANQDDFIYDRCQIMVATNAFGMGIDKSNVSFVIHYNMPKNLEGYYQEAGRAGRDGSAAECVLLYGALDVKTNRFMIEKSRENNTDLSEEARETVYEKDLERLKYMTFYCTTTDCLREFILRYFGEKTSNYCGNCSNCTEGFETVDITVDAQKILSCVYRVHQRGSSYGMTMITDILRGSKQERLMNLRLDSLSTYGIMADTSVKQIRAEIAYLLENGYLMLTQGDYPQLRLTARSAEILRDRKSLSMKLPKEKAPAAAKPKRGDPRSTDSTLFGALRMRRREIATEESVPAYVIFTDATLEDMCKRLPTDLAEFREVSGVGKRKAEKYGERFCSVIAAYLKLHPEQTNPGNRA